MPGGAVFIRPSRRGSADEEAGGQPPAVQAKQAAAGRAEPSEGQPSEGQPEQEEQLVQQQHQDKEQPLPQDAKQAKEDRADEADQAMKELSHLLEAYMVTTSKNVQGEGVPEEIQAEEDEVDRAPGRAYTEGGLVFLPDQQTGTDTCRAACRAACRALAPASF